MARRCYRERDKTATDAWIEKEEEEPRRRRKKRERKDTFLCKNWISVTDDKRIC
jgi:hypothetical protein